MNKEFLDEWSYLFDLGNKYQIYSFDFSDLEDQKATIDGVDNSCELWQQGMIETLFPEYFKNNKLTIFI